VSGLAKAEAEAEEDDTVFIFSIINTIYKNSLKNFNFLFINK
jgi:hypothetical protein